MSVDRPCVVCRATSKGKTCGKTECIAAFAAYVNATPIPRNDCHHWQQGDRTIKEKDDLDDHRPPVRKPRSRE